MGKIFPPPPLTPSIWFAEMSNFCPIRPTVITLWPAIFGDFGQDVAAYFQMTITDGSSLLIKLSVEWQFRMESKCHYYYLNEGGAI